MVFESGLRRAKQLGKAPAFFIFEHFLQLFFLRKLDSYRNNFVKIKMPHKIQGSKLAIAPAAVDYKKNIQPKNISAVKLLLPFSTKDNVYPLGETRPSVNQKINDLTARKAILSGPNCWGTVTFILGITATLRYVSDIEYGQFVTDAKIIKYSTQEQLKEGAILSIWSNADNSIEHHHAALVIDGSLKQLFEKPGPDEIDKPVNKFFEQVISEAISVAFPQVILLNQFDQPTGKYATLLDFSDIASKRSSGFEEELDAYNREGILLNKEPLKNLLQIYKSEINRIEDARELSLAEGFYYLLLSISNELLKIDTSREDAKLANDKPAMLKIAKLMASHSELRSIVDQAMDSIQAQIQSYRHSL